MAVALTVLCQPFFHLRCSELGEKTPHGESKHVRDLTLKFNAACCYVTLTVLVGAYSSQKGTAARVVEHWLDVADQLLKLRNYHMAFAVQAGLAKHQVDRLLQEFIGDRNGFTACVSRNQRHTTTARTTHPITVTFF